MKPLPHCVAFLILALSIPLAAQTLPKRARSLSAPTTPTATPTATPSPSTTVRALPFHGMIIEVDQNAKTFTLGGKQKSRVFKVTERTAISRSQKPATMKDVVENEEVSGAYWKNADGTFEAKTVKLGLTEKPKPPTPTPSLKDSASPAPSASPKE